MGSTPRKLGKLPAVLPKPLAYDMDDPKSMRSVTCRMFNACWLIENFTDIDPRLMNLIKELRSDLKESLNISRKEEDVPLGRTPYYTLGSKG